MEWPAATWPLTAFSSLNSAISSTSTISTSTSTISTRYSKIKPKNKKKKKKKKMKMKMMMMMVRMIAPWLHVSAWNDGNCVFSPREGAGRGATKWGRVPPHQPPPKMAVNPGSRSACSRGHVLPYANENKLPTPIWIDKTRHSDAKQQLIRINGIQLD